MRLQRRISSIALEAALELPVGDTTVVLELLPTARVQIVLDHIFAEGFPQHLRALERTDRVAQGAGHLRQLLTAIGIPLDRRLELQLLVDASKPCGDQGGEGEIGIEIGSTDPTLDADTGRSFSAKAVTSRAVVRAPDRFRG